MFKRLSFFQIFLNEKKIWLNSWCILKQDYSSIFQEDLNLSIFLRGSFINESKLILINLRIYRNFKHILFDIAFCFLKWKNKFHFWLLTTKLNKILKYKQKVFVTIKKMSFKKGFFCCSFLGLLIARLIEKQVKFKGKIIKLILKKISLFFLGIHLLIKGKIKIGSVLKKEMIFFGKLPFQNMQIYLDFKSSIANTNKGLKNIKIWLYK